MLRRIKNLLLHKQPVLNNLTRGPWLKRFAGEDKQTPVSHRMFSYATPAIGAAPVSGEIVHSDNIINKLSINHIAMDGHDISPALAQLASGDFISVGGSVREIVAPLQPAAGYTSITIEPTNQLPDGVYPVTAWKGTGTFSAPPVLNLDGDANPDTVVFSQPPVTISEDADSINIDVNGDGVADIVIPK
jgi:hypothetical protein